jgi:hypothetical protein
VAPIQFSQEGSQKLQIPESLKYPLGQVRRHLFKLNYLKFLKLKLRKIILFIKNKNFYNFKKL